MQPPSDHAQLRTKCPPPPPRKIIGSDFPRHSVKEFSTPNVWHSTNLNHKHCLPHHPIPRVGDGHNLSQVITQGKGYN